MAHFEVCKGGCLARSLVLLLKHNASCSAWNVGDFCSKTGRVGIFSLLSLSISPDGFNCGAKPAPLFYLTFAQFFLHLQCLSSRLCFLVVFIATIGFVQHHRSSRPCPSADREKLRGRLVYLATPSIYTTCKTRMYYRDLFGESPRRLICR